MWTTAAFPRSQVSQPWYGETLPLTVRFRRERAAMSWAPARAVGWLEVLAAVVVAGAALGLDVLGQLLALPAALLLLGVGLRDLLLRPTLAADADGLTVVNGARHVAATWAEVERLRVVTDRRAPLLEIDLGEAVVVLPRRRLGAAPAVVLDELTALRPRP